jgi:hypothetical protein
MLNKHQCATRAVSHCTFSMVNEGWEKYFFLAF